MYTTSDKKEQRVLDDSGIGLVGIKRGKRILGAPKSEAYEMFLTYDCTQEQAEEIIGGKPVKEESELVEEDDICIGVTKAGDRCKRKATHGKYCAAHKQGE